MFSTDFGLGTLISNLSQRYGSGKYLRERLTRERRANYGDDLLARQEAWKAAGLHPLVGMQIPMDGPTVGGGGGGGPAPRFNFGFGEGKVDEDTKRMRTAQADLAELQVEAARRKLNEQPGNPPAPSSAMGYGEPVTTVAPYVPVAKPQIVQVYPGSERELPGAADMVQVKPSEQTSFRSGFPHVAAGVGPGSSEYQLTPRLKVLLPQATSVSEALEGISESKILLGTWWLINKEHYGEAQTREAFRMLGLPVQRYREVPVKRQSDVFWGPRPKTPFP